VRKAIFLDRDGVLNQAVVKDGVPRPPGSLAELTILPGVPEALAALKHAGYALVVVTNQPDVARGTQSRETVEAMNEALLARLPLDEIRTCYHDDADRCACRKPAPGLLTAAPRYDLARSVMIGDRWRDIDAGRRAGVGVTILVDYHYDETAACEPDVRARSLPDAASWILQRPAEGTMKRVDELTVKIFGDGADLDSMKALYRQPFIRGFTTNPTLMQKAGIRDYRGFARDVVGAIPDRPISFEVFSDDFAGMERQAREIATWGDNVYVKIPVTNTKRESAVPLVRRLSHEGVRLNVTALMTLDQVRDVVDALAGGAPSCVSVFAGRIADTGRDPLPLMISALDVIKRAPAAELIWASPRELLNVFQADEIGCHIITVTADILKKLELVGYDLDEFSLDTVKMFHADATRAGFSL